MQESFDKGGIGIGDAISVSVQGKEFEGVLMPNTEANADDAIIIKMGNGYNIAFKFSEVKISKKGTKNRKPEFPQVKIESRTELPNISLLYTGGTIGSKIDYTTGGVYMLTKPEELLYEVPEISEITNIKVRNLFSIPSEDMSSSEWSEMAKRVSDELNSGSKGAVISMGTDTMHYAAAALSFMLDGLNSPVVMTGAQRSSDRGSSDAFMNLFCASAAAAQSDIAEVSLCMHATSSDDYCNIIRGTKARKMHSSRRDAFRPINDRPIGKVDRKGKITYISGYKKASGTSEKIKMITGFENRTAIVVAHPNSDPSIIDFFAEKGYKGIIIEGTGLGHTPVSTKIKEMSWLENIRAAAERGIIVGITTQCIYGRTNSSVYRNLRLLNQAGAIHCEDMTPETAYVKLGWLLGNYGRDKAAAMLTKNLRGEIKERTEYDTFLV